MTNKIEAAQESPEGCVCGHRMHGREVCRLTNVDGYACGCRNSIANAPEGLELPERHIVGCTGDAHCDAGKYYKQMSCPCKCHYELEQKGQALVAHKIAQTPMEWAQEQQIISLMARIETQHIALTAALRRATAAEGRLRFQDDTTPLPCGCPTFYLYMNEGCLWCGMCGKNYFSPMFGDERAQLEAKVTQLDNDKAALSEMLREAAIHIYMDDDGKVLWAKIHALLDRIPTVEAKVAQLEALEAQRVKELADAYESEKKWREIAEKSLGPRTTKSNQEPTP